MAGGVQRDADTGLARQIRGEMLPRLAMYLLSVDEWGDLPYRW